VASHYRLPAPHRYRLLLNGLLDTHALLFDLEPVCFDAQLPNDE
jgi:hypothetical protein